MNRLVGIVSLLLGGWLALAAASVQAGVVVTGAWARATMPGQTVAGVYMQIRSDAAAKLVGVSSAAAKSAELHRMSHEGGVMKMRHVDSLELPAGKTVALEPGGYHIMLMDIGQPLKPGDRVKLTLLVETGGKRQQVPVEAEVRPLAED
jgi:hypothetical protein